VCGALYADGFFRCLPTLLQPVNALPQAHYSATVVEQRMLTLKISFGKSCFAFFRTMQQQRQLGAYGVHGVGLDFREFSSSFVREYAEKL
jgi:hypothetical protein